MYRGKKIGVVVPAWNEELHIGDVLKGMPEYVDAVYVVDDASTDRTPDIVREHVVSRVGAGSHACPQGGADAPRVPSASESGSGVGAGSHACPQGGVAGSRVYLITHDRNRGVGGAIVTGYKRCLADGMDIAAVMAGDNQMDPVELPRLLDPIVDGRADYAKGDRTSRRAHLTGMSAWRRFGNWLLKWLTRIAVGNMRVNDPQNGYTAASGDLLAELPVYRLYPRYGYCNQLLAWVSMGHRRLVDVPMPSRYLGEKSKIRYGVYIPKVSWLLLRLFVGKLSGLWKTQSGSLEDCSDALPGSAEPETHRDKQPVAVHSG